MLDEIEIFRLYLTTERGLSLKTLEAYLGDIGKFLFFAKVNLWLRQMKKILWPFLSKKGTFLPRARCGEDSWPLRSSTVSSIKRD